MASKVEIMPRVEGREGQLAIPVTDDVREKLGLHAGDELAVHVIEGSVVYTPATPDARERAWKRIESVTDQVRPTAAQARKPISEIEQEIVGEVKRIRRSRRA
jgi:bifunctional DNA-binding transcriptional regulator/antitoxin component of YhaV-PrlF toxin-antitoxin module